MNRSERDSFTAVTPTDIAYGEGACLETPRPVFDRLYDRFGFDIDLTANEQNCLLPLWFGPGPNQGLMSDALILDWSKFGKSGYSNPPYGPYIPKILTAALRQRDHGFTSVFLLPNRAGGWFTNLVLPYYSELWYVAPRIVFWYGGKPRVNPNTEKNLKRIAKGKEPIADGALFDSIVVIYKPIAGYLYESQPRHRQGLLFPSPPSTRPNVWNWKTGELRY